MPDRGVLSCLATYLSLLLGCAPDPVATYRIGGELDVAAFRNEHGEETFSVVRLGLERYEYRQCTVEHRDARYEIDVSTSGRIVGLTAKVPCEPGEILSKSAALRERFDACYPGGRGEKPRQEVELWTKYEPGSHRLVATCFEPSHGAVVRAYRKRTGKPER